MRVIPDSVHSNTLVTGNMTIRHCIFLRVWFGQRCGRDERSRKPRAPSIR